MKEGRYLHVIVSLRLKKFLVHIVLCFSMHKHKLMKLNTLCLVSAPTMRGHTIPDRVPTPLEMPIRILA